MPRAASEKCRLCSKLSDQQAKLLHGEEGDHCWAGKPCHDRRSYYRHREEKNYRRRKRRQITNIERGLITPFSPQVVTLEVLAPAIPAAVVHWYRETKDSPLHAVGAELWMGNDRVARIEPVHCLGLTELHIKTLLVQILQHFSQFSGQKLERFRSTVELNPANCPIRPCPLHPDFS